MFDLTFRVDEPVVYSLAGSISISSESQDLVVLLGPGGALYEPTFTPNQGNDFADTGTLDPESTLAS